MKTQICQELKKARSWDDLIGFTEAKIKELKQALQTFRSNKQQGLPLLPGTQLTGQNSGAATRS